MKSQNCANCNKINFGADYLQISFFAMNNQQNWRQAGNPQITEAQMAQYRYQQQQQQMRMNQQRLIPQQANFRPPAQSPVASIKRPNEDVVQIKTVKMRLEEQLLKDHSIVSNINQEVFQSKQDVLDRLLPFHVYQIVEIDHLKYDKLSFETIVENAKSTLEKAVKVLEEQDQFYEKFNKQRADEICQIKGRK